MAGKYEMTDLVSVTKAASMKMMMCPDPDCGPHLVMMDRAGEPICQFVLSRESIESVISSLVYFGSQRQEFFDLLAQVDRRSKH